MPWLLWSWSSRQLHSINSLQWWEGMHTYLPCCIIFECVFISTMQFNKAMWLHCKRKYISLCILTRLTTKKSSCRYIKCYFPLFQSYYNFTRNITSSFVPQIFLYHNQLLIYKYEFCHLLMENSHQTLYIKCIKILKSNVFSLEIIKCAWVNPYFSFFLISNSPWVAISYNVSKCVDNIITYFKFFLTHKKG